MSVTQDLINIVKLQLEDMDYEFVDLIYGKRGSSWILQIFVDKDGGITVDDCKKISHQISYELDRHQELLKHAYSLEISSPGLDRALKTERDFERFINKEINMKLFNPVDDRKTFIAKIIKVENGNIIVENSTGKQIAVDIKNIAHAKLEVKV